MTTQSVSTMPSQRAFGQRNQSEPAKAVIAVVCPEGKEA